MPINSFGNRLFSFEKGFKNDIFVFLKKPYFKTDSIESNMGEVIDTKNQFRTKIKPCLAGKRDAVCKSYVGSGFNDASIFINKAFNDFNVKNLDIIKFVRDNSMPAVGEYLAAKYYVEKTIFKIADELTLVRKNHNNSFNDSRWTNKNSITFNPQAVHVNQVILKSYVDQLHQKNERSRRDLGIDFSTESSALANNNQDNSFSDYKLTHLNSIKYKMFRSSDYELASRKNFDDAINEVIILRFNQTLQDF